MNVYVGDQAKRMFHNLDIPKNSIGVFECKNGEWIYWFTDGWTFDSGSASSELEAHRMAKENFR